MDQVAEIREKVDIVALINEYVPLRQLGRSFKTRCPFHNEKTPSFVVSQERQIWHCFGCGKGGDAYSFLMEYEHMEFPEALRFLAKRVGVTLVTTQRNAVLSSQKERLFALNRLALEFYHFLLMKHPAGKKARDYLIEKRGLTEPLLETFQLGFSPAGNTLFTYLTKKKKYEAKELVGAGLATPRLGAMGDFFTNRIIFPLFDHRDNVIGFAGRVFDSQREPKYINTRETLVYQKGSTFFGIQTAKEAIRKEEKTVLVEGEFDAISCFREGITNAVAIKGTALTGAQVKLLSRYCKKITLCFDMDRAGIEATKRSIPLIEDAGLLATVVITPDGKDPDEALRTNAAFFKKALREDVGVYDFLLSEAASRLDAKSAEGKRKISEEVLPVFSHIQNEIVKEHYIKKLADMLDVSSESIGRQLDKLSFSKAKATIPQLVKREQRDRIDALEEYIVALIVQGKEPRIMLEVFFQLLKPYQFQTPAYGVLCKELMAFLKDAHKKVVDFTKTAPKEIVGLFDVCFLLPIAQFASVQEEKTELIKAISELQMLTVRKKVKQLSMRIKTLEKDGDEQKVGELQQQMDTLLATLQMAQ